MIIEDRRLWDLPVRTTEGREAGRIKHIVFDLTSLKIWGLEVEARGIFTGRKCLPWEKIVALGLEGAVIDKAKDLQSDLSVLLGKRKEGGEIIGLRATTQSNSHLGRVHDLQIDAESGLLVRFLLRQLLNERIIPRQFLITINRRQAVFQDEVLKPTFDKLASQTSCFEPVK